MTNTSSRPLSRRAQALIDATQTKPTDPRPEVAPPRASRTIGVPGLAREFDRADKEALGRLALLEAKYGKGTALPCLPLDPKDVRPGGFFNRFASSFDPESNKAFGELLEDIRLHQGNLVPGLVRPIEGALDAPRYELVYGERRWRACLDAGVPFKAEIAEGLSADEVIALHSVENRFRPDLSVLESAKQFKSWLESMRRADDSLPEGAVESLAQRLGLGRRYAFKLRAIGEIPETVIDAIDEPTRLTGRVALLLADACKKDRAGVDARIRTLSASAGALSAKEQALYLAGAKQKAARGASAPRTIAWPTSDEVSRLLLKRLRAIESELQIDLGLGD